MTQSRRRVSYVIPPPTTHVRRLQLPPHGSQRLGAVSPLLTPHPTQAASDDVEETPPWARHPRHRLGVSALALDTTTCLAGRSAPEGILYSGGRDGLVIARDLRVPMKRRRAQLSSQNRLKDRWEVITGWADDAIEEEGEDGEERGPDGDVLGEVAAQTKKQRSASISGDVQLENMWETDMGLFKAGVHSEFRQSAQAHSDWINDILLCNYNQTVITASSDGTVKSWNPHSSIPTDPVVIGTHVDYVRCLSLCRERNWVASGSFDRTIKLWDLSRPSSQSPEPLVTLHPADATAAKASVYAIASDPFGRTIASGSPERVVRLWDPRTGKRTGKLVGHTDNIRAILLSEDGRYLLTGSADASIKLWSLASQRCLHTFTHHTESVWSLYSSHPYLETFYSGDRTGLVCRVDVEGCGDLSDGECILLCNDSTDCSHPASEGVNSIAVMDDNLLWTASGSSTIKQWHIPQPRRSRVVEQGDGIIHSPPIKRRLPVFQTSGIASEASTRPSTGSGEQPRRMSSAPSVRSLFFDQQNKPRDLGLDDKLNGLPLDSLVKLLSPNDPFASFTHGRTMRDPEVATLYSAASIASVPRGAGRAFTYPALQSSPLQSSRTEETVIPTSIARANYEERELASDATPYCTQPDDIIKGDDGLVRSIILNDRIHALTVDTAGEVGVWDIVRGVCLGTYHPEDVAAASHAGSVSSGAGDTKERSPREALEAVRERIEGEGVANTWCAVDTKAGVLTVHMTERCFEAEVYADEVGFAHDKHISEETKLNVGKWVLRNLFIGFIREETRPKNIRDSPPGGAESVLPPSISRVTHEASLESHRKLRHRRTHSIESSRKGSKHIPMSSTVINSPKMIPAVAPVPATALPRSSPLLTPMIPLHPPKEALPPITQSPLPSPANEMAPTTPFHQRTRSGTVDGSIVRTPSTGPPKEDYFSIRRQSSTAGPDETPTAMSLPTPTANAKIEPPPTPSTPSGLMGRLKSFGKMGKRPVSDSASPVLGAVTPTLDTVNPVEDIPIEIAKTPIQQLLSGPLTPPGNADAPLHAFPPQTVVLISEEATPSYRTLYRGYVSGTQYDTKILEEVMPLWLAEYLLLNKLPPMAPLQKMSFVLLPWNKDPDQEPLPELLNSYVQDKLEKATSAESRAGSIRSSVDSHHAAQQQQQQHQGNRSPRLRPDEQYEILCNEAVLPVDMTLAAVRQYVWRQSAELVMYYRRKVSTLSQSQSGRGSVTVREVPVQRGEAL
ncbi:hypothetical protein CC1G_02644 [Coprinopsis cinerea okayama7|uniref:Uncharacterized protein n=1 Tax=Coprinopsis cinerea (strain Okayama-7 / 130 / ATCC MYA-4618 / FGSC 9003) TaxID=240176 RepID=A8PBH1_COPC7|nr:hypothetical protein CC1G_02644 [Coprinopsis cinerea okayama7\|eukprot:XP_001840181.2 hypothetical protein CC1G_02644 [Coprinopsis cinerea okayama7\